MKIIKNYIHGKLVESMLEDDNFIPIYSGDDLIDFVYRKVVE
jgi:hypothetical protein